jgi:uncharacterized protein (DUF342 family)
MCISTEIKNGLSFKFNLDQSKLFAVFTPCENKVELTVNTLKQRLEDEKLASLFFIEESLLEFVHQYNHNENKSFELHIAERHNANFDVYLSIDKLKAYLTLTENLGGNVVTLSEVKNCLQEKNVVFGIIPDEDIQGFLQQGKSAEFIIAQGIETIDGEDTQFKSFIEPNLHERKPHVDEDGNIDYRELGDFVITVQQNHVLMQRIPPTEGIKGKNVIGETIAPKKGENIPFSSDKRGVYLDSNDNNFLLSAITGQPIIITNGVIVSPVLSIEKVNFETGNVRFDGSIIVAGDVIDGMKIYAVEDIIIEGNVDNAKIECMGNLTIKGFVTGNCQLLAHGDIVVKGGVQGSGDELLEGEYPAKIVSHGSVIVSFAENFDIEAGLDIIVEKYAMNNHLMAQNKIVAGSKNTGKKSSIIGGVAWAMMLIKAASIGSNVGLKTKVRVGFNPYIYKRIANIKKMLEPNEKEQDGIQKILEFMAHHPEKSNPDILEKLHHTLCKLQAMAELYRGELKELTANSNVIEGARIIAERGVCTGTEIRINDKIWKAQENRAKSIFRIENREITINSR